MRAVSLGRGFRSTAVSAVCAVLLAACGGNPESMLASAKDYMAKSDRNAASIQLKNALQKNPNLAEARFLLGKIYLEQGDFQSAEKELSRALDAGFSPDQAVPALAQALLLEGQAQRIVTELAGKNLTLSDSKAALQTYVGLARLQQGNKAEAEQEFNAALGTSSGFGLAKVGLARIKALNKDFDGALADVESVLKEQPLPEAFALKGDLLLVKNRPDEALAAFEALIKQRPTDLAAYQSIISLLIRANKLEDATARIASMKKAVGNHPLAIYFQSFIDLRQGKSKEAYDGIVQVLRAVPDHVPSLMLAAMLQVQKGDFVQAQENIDKVLAKVPNQPFARRLLVSSYLGQRDPGRAVEALQPLLKDAQSDVSILNLAGQAYAMNGDLPRSEEYFSRAAKLDPSNAQYRTRLGVTRLASGEVDQAFQDLETASSMDAEGVQADITLILAHLRRNETAKAMEAVQKLEKKRPNDPMTFNMKGGILMAMKDAPGARKAFERALEIKPDFLAAVSNLARLDIQDKKLDVARKRYEAYIAANPSNAQGYLQYGELMAMTGVPLKDVQALLDKGLAANPTSSQILTVLVRLLAQTGEFKRALTLAQENSAATPDDPAALDLLGRTQVAAGESQQAVTTFSKLATRLPQSPAPLIALADINLAAKDMTAAEQNLRKALSLKGDSIEAQQRLISVLVSTKRSDAAIAMAKDVQRQRKDSPIGYVLEGEVLAAMQKNAEAIGPFEEAYKRDKTAQSLVRLHNAEMVAGKTQEAAKLVADWNRSNPRDLTVRTYLAERSLAERKYDQAAQQYRQMLEIAPKNAMLLNNLAWVQGKLNDKNAIATALQAAELAPNSPVVIDTLGVLQVESGDVAKGVESLKKAVSLGPTLPQLRLNLAKALIKSGDKDGARREVEAGLKIARENTPVRKELEQLLTTL